MPSGLLGRPLAERLSAILADVSTNRDRKPTRQCPLKEFSPRMRITKIVQKLQKEFQRKQDLNNAYKLSKERREYQGDKTWIFGGPENGE